MFGQYTDFFIPLKEEHTYCTAGENVDGITFLKGALNRKISKYT